MGAIQMRALLLLSTMSMWAHALPKEYRTGFDRFEGTFEFANENVMVRRQDCWRRPIFFYLFTPEHLGGRGGAADLEAFVSKRLDGPLCILAISTRTLSVAEGDAFRQAAPRIPVFSAESQLNSTFVSMLIGRDTQFPVIRLLNRDGAVARGESGGNWTSHDLNEAIDSEIGAVIKELPLGWRSQPDEASPGVAERVALMEKVGDALKRRAFLEVESIALAASQPASRYSFSSSSKLADVFDALGVAWSGGGALALERLMRDYVGAFPKSATANLALIHSLMARGDDLLVRGDVEGSLRAHRDAMSLLENDSLKLKRNPQAYVLLPKVMHRLHWDLDSMLDVVKEGVRRHPDYLQIQSAFALHLSALESKSRAGWVDFAAHPLALPRNQSPDETYVYIVSSVCADAWWLGPNCIRAVERKALDWNRLRMGFVKIIEKWPKFTETRDSFAWYSCVFDDRETAREQFDIIGDRFSKAVWGNEAAYLYWRRWASEARR